MILTLTKDKTLSYFVYRAVKIAIFCFALHSALSLGKPWVVHCFSLANSPEEKGFAHDALRDSKGYQKLDRLQSAFSLKIRQVLPAGTFANNAVTNGHWDETPFTAVPLVYLGYAWPHNF